MALVVPEESERDAATLVRFIMLINKLANRSISGMRISAIFRFLLEEL